VVQTPSQRLDPAAWGGDHVNKPLPEFVSGDECLFCHRNDVGPSWSSNRHNRTVRELEADSPAQAKLPAFKDQIQLVLGGSRMQRFLRRSEEFGKLEVLSAAWNPREDRLVNADGPHWDKSTFGDGCAGCHATAVDSKAKTFAALALDCYACHGDVDLNHSKQPELAHLARKRNEPARVVTSICAQCHVRTGKSASTGLPYPNNFVAGDNLFRDFKVDLSPEAISRLNPGDRHVLENVRDVVVQGKEEVTCLSCHDVHKQSSKKHHKVQESDSCTTCHNATGSKKTRPPYEVHSPTCGY
jgi:predicted CXXCH cytochrome family protein